MKNLAGLKIISDNSIAKIRTIEFVFKKHEKTTAIETLINCIDAGNIINLNDNRDKREGSINLKKENDVYLQSGGGHGFSIDWKPANLEEITWLIKITAPFNFGDSNGSNGTIKQKCVNQTAA